MRNLIAASVLAVAAVPMTASASLVTQWQYLATSNWSQPVVFSASGNGTTSVTSDVISWGATGGSHKGAGPKNRSALGDRWHGSPCHSEHKCSHCIVNQFHYTLQ
ncbi:MAG: hypothetical protein U5L02_13160 [Rheinheimera sp.]|nr:hypothetical protein [Rheinheimera sp.]